MKLQRCVDLKQDCIHPYVTLETWQTDIPACYYDHYYYFVVWADFILQKNIIERKQCPDSDSFSHLSPVSK